MDETLAEVAKLLYGDGAYEMVSKLTQAEEKRNRTQARVGLATNVIGIGAGAAATPAAFKSVGEARNRVRESKGQIPKIKKPSAFKSKMGSLKAVKAGREFMEKPKVGLGLAAGGAALQVGNLAGDFVANRVLARSAKKEKVGKGYISKMEPGGADLHVESPKSKARKYALARVNETPQMNEIKVQVARKKDAAKNKLSQGIGKSGDVVWEGEFSKVDSDKRQVFGWASIIEKDGQPVHDLQGDIIESEEIEKSAYDYVIKSRKGGDMHRREADDTPVHASDMIESFVVTPEKISKMGLPEGSLPTGWWGGFKVNDDDAWNLVKSGKRTAFSIHGRGQRTPMED